MSQLSQWPWMPPESNAEHSRVESRAVTGALASGLAGIGEAVLLDNAWSACSAGLGLFNWIAAGIDGFIVAVLAGIAFLVPVLLLRRHHGNLDLILGIAAAATVAYLWFAAALPGSPTMTGPSLTTPTGIGTCQGNVPPWWPWWLPLPRLS